MNRMNNGQADETVDVTIAGPEREPISVRLDTPEQLDIVREIVSGTTAARQELDELRERQIAEMRQVSERGNTLNQERFERLCIAAGIPVEANRESLKIDTEYLERHGIAFLTEDGPQDEEPEGGLAAILGRLGGSARTQF